MHKPPRRGQPLYKGQITRPQCAPYFFKGFTVACLIPRMDFAQLVPRPSHRTHPLKIKMGKKKFGGTCVQWELGSGNETPKRLGW